MLLVYLVNFTIYFFQCEQMSIINSMYRARDKHAVSGLPNPIHLEDEVRFVLSKDQQDTTRNYTPTNHSHVKPLSMPILVNYFLWNVLCKIWKCYFVADVLLLSHMKGLDIWSSHLPNI